MITIVDLLLMLLALPVALMSGYLLACALLSRKTPVPTATARRLRFEVIVPAHNESTVIMRVLRSLQRLDWPAENLRISVLADNCTDETALLARLAGVHVRERTDTTLQGKGHALADAFSDCRRRGWADAVVVVDADSEVSPGLLQAFAARIVNGAGAVQAHYGVLNPQASWRTRLMAIALACFHQQRSRARERLGLSCGIRGNGWCVTLATLDKVPYRAFSLTEDLEYGIDLGLAGHRVHYADEATVSAEMVSGAQAARSQRQRWEHGRWQLVRSRVGRLLRSVHGRGAWVRLDLACDLMLLPLSYLTLAISLLICGAGTAQAWGFASDVWLRIGVLAAAGVILHVLRGWQLSGVGPRGLLDLLRIPGYVLWKVSLMARRHDASDWVKTRREGH